MIGAGYVGLTTAACLADLGHDVTCADVVPAKVEALNEGRIPIVEAGLEDLVRRGVGGGRLRFVLGAARAAEGAEAVFLCVPTPRTADGSADMGFIEAAASDIGPVLTPGCMVVNKSTVPVGSTHVVERALGRDDAFVVSNPEFLREGSAVHDFLNPDRVVIGCDDAATAVRFTEVFNGIRAPFVVTDPATAETIKYASNAFLATKVSFVNAMANLCEAVGADMAEVVLGMGYDKRIGFEFLRPGPGWGGSCFPKDTLALVNIAEDAGYDFSLLRGVIAVNEQQHERVVAKVQQAAGGTLEGVRVAVWGLTFKAGTDDLRDSPALAVVELLAKHGADVRAYDPTAREPLPGMTTVRDPYEACDDASVLAILTEWDEFRGLDLAQVRTRMRRPRVVDARNLLDPAAVRRSGFHYQGVGVR